MIDGKFDVVFRGQTVKGMELEVVKQNLVQLFKSTPAAIEKLFAGSEVTIKKNLEYAAAMKYQAALKKAGALALIKEVETKAAEPAIKSQYSGKANFATNTKHASQDRSGSAKPMRQEAAVADETGQSALKQPNADKPQDTNSIEENGSAAKDSLTIAEVGANILPPKVYEKREVDTSALSMAPVGERILPPKPPEKHQQPNIDHLKLADD